MRPRSPFPSRRLLVLCTWLIAVASGYAESTNHAARVAQRPEQKIGRPVRVVSLSFHDKSVAEIAQVVDREGAKGVDLIILPETWCGQKESPEALDGPIVTTMAALAKRHGTYLVCPIDRRDGERRLNTAVLIDRGGRISGVYDKVYPYWSEFELKPSVEPGHEVRVFQTDVGRLGLALCFDVNFPEVWQRLADQGAELVVWPSAYSAGTSLQAHALNHHFYIVTSTLTRDCLVYDITGEELLYEKSDDLNVSRITLDLDRGVYHSNFNIEKRDKLLKEHGQELKQVKWLDREQWFVLQATEPGVSARALAKQYGLEELRDYLGRSRREIDQRRGRGLADSNRVGTADN
jgi:predicted amidohydrolase